MLTVRKRYVSWGRWFAFIFLLGAACQRPVETTTPAITEGASPEPGPATTPAITEGAHLEPTPATAEATMAGERPDKALVVCMAIEPDSLYLYGGEMLGQRAVLHGLYENLYTNLAYGYQAQGLEKLPSLADGDAAVQRVEVSAGTMVVDESGAVVTLVEGVRVINADGISVTFDGTPILMAQLVADFAFKPLVWEDGTAVTAADSVYSFEVAADPGTPGDKFKVERTAGYEASGELSVRWTGLPGWQDTTYFLNVWRPLPRHAWAGLSAAKLVEAGESNRRPLANGPFRLVEWVAGDHITLVRNEHYYRAAEGLPYLDSVTYRFVPDTNQLLVQLLAGRCDIGTQDGIGADQRPFLIEAANNGLLVPYFQAGTVLEHIDFGINPVDDYAATRPDWFEDVRVRQAMTACTNRQAMIDQELYGQSEIPQAYIPTLHPLYPAGLSGWPYDVALANSLLDEAGYRDRDGDGIREDATTGAPFEVRLVTTAGSELRPALAEIFRQNMVDCGIRVSLTFLAAGEFFADGPAGPVFGRQFDLALFGWLTGSEPPCGLYTSEQLAGPPAEFPAGWSGQNNTGWRNSAFDGACESALAAVPGMREYEAGHQEAVRIFVEEAPVIPLLLRVRGSVTRPEVRNFHFDASEQSELWNLFELDLGQE